MSRVSACGVKKAAVRAGHAPTNEFRKFLFGFLRMANRVYGVAGVGQSSTQQGFEVEWTSLGPHSCAQSGSGLCLLLSGLGKGSLGKSAWTKSSGSGLPMPKGLGLKDPGLPQGPRGAQGASGPPGEF